MKKAAISFGIGFELVGLVWFANVFGEKLDEKMGWHGNGSTYAVLIAFVIWFIHMVVMAVFALKDETKNEDNAKFR